MGNGNIPITYRVRFEKDHASVRLTYDLSVPMGGAALIADFQATVAGTNLITGMVPGQTAFNGVKFYTLAKPEEDATVSFTMTTNQGWTAGDEDTLRGEKLYDEADFSG